MAGGTVLVYCGFRISDCGFKKESVMPHEFAVGGVFVPPLLIAAILGTIAAVVTARLLNRYRLSRYFFYPPLVFVALAIIYTVFIGTFIIRV
jgi:hypothetical protein